MLLLNGLLVNKMLNLKETGVTVVLKGKNRHGKNRIHEHGKHWRVLDWTAQARPGERFIRSKLTGDERWLSNDFIVVCEKLNDHD